jgi:hypothetical protein
MPGLNLPSPDWISSTWSYPVLRWLWVKKTYFFLTTPDFACKLKKRPLLRLRPMCGMSSSTFRKYVPTYFGITPESGGHIPKKQGNSPERQSLSGLQAAKPRRKSFLFSIRTKSGAVRFLSVDGVRANAIGITIK